MVERYERGLGAAPSDYVVELAKEGRKVSPPGHNEFSIKKSTMRNS